MGWEVVGRAGRTFSFLSRRLIKRFRPRHSSFCGRSFSLIGLHYYQTHKCVDIFKTQVIIGPLPSLPPKKNRAEGLQFGNNCISSELSAPSALSIVPRPNGEKRKEEINAFNGSALRLSYGETMRLGPVVATSVKDPSLEHGH